MDNDQASSWTTMKFMSLLGRSWTTMKQAHERRVNETSWALSWSSSFTRLMLSHMHHLRRELMDNDEANEASSWTTSKRVNDELHELCHCKLD
jgi:hypothetical protein